MHRSAAGRNDFWLWAGLFLLGCWPAMAAEIVAVVTDTQDYSPPLIDHQTPSAAATVGKAACIRATVVDTQSGVKTVVLYYRTIGASDYARQVMLPEGDDVFSAAVPVPEVRQPGLEYYIEATDYAGNHRLRGVGFSPLVLAVAADDTSVDGSVDDAWLQQPLQPAAATGSERRASVRRDWIHWAAAGLVGSLFYCYSSCSCARQCEDDSGSVVLKVPNP